MNLHSCRQKFGIEVFDVRLPLSPLLLILFVNLLLETSAKEPASFSILRDGGLKGGSQKVMQDFANPPLNVFGRWRNKLVSAERCLTTLRFGGRGGAQLPASVA